MPAEVETMFYAREVPWHGLGTKVDQTLTSAEALKVSGLDWKVEQLKVSLELPDGGYQNIPGRVANTRMSDLKVLGIPTVKYAVVQNHEAFEWTDNLLGQGVQYETAGALQGGKRVWLLAKMEEKFFLNKDEVTPYLVFINSHDGSTGVRVCLTPVRVVCQNTLTMAIKQANRCWTTNHVGDIQKKMEIAATTLGLAKEYMDNIVIEAEAMAETNMYKDELKKFTDAMWPISDGFTERQAANVEYFRSAFDKALKQPDLKKFKATTWGVYGAVVDVVTHVRPLRETPGFKDNLWRSVMDGHPDIQKAQQLLLKVRV